MSYYKFGDHFKWFMARVSDINDPEYLGRVRIRVLHTQTGELGRVSKNSNTSEGAVSGIDNENLLWAWPLSGIQSASLSWRKLTEKNAGLEEFNTPDWIDAVGISPTGIAVGTYVFGFYLDGHEQNIPIIFGTYHKRSMYPEPPSGDVTRNSMLQLETPEPEPELFSDVSALARGVEGGGGQKLPKEYITAQKLPVTSEPKSAYRTKYPYNTTYTTKSGHAIELDDTPKHERIHVWHKSGSYEEIANGPTESGKSFTGRRVKKTVGDDFEIVVQDKNILIKKNLNEEVGNNVTISIGEDATITVSGAAKIVANGGISIAAAGGVTITEGTLSVKDSLAVESAATGSFTTISGQVVDVQNGIIVNIK